MGVQREFRIFERGTRALEHTIDVSGKGARARGKVEDGLYRKVDFERFYVEQWVVGYSINKARGAILDFLDQDRFSEFDVHAMATSTGYSLSWCRATATVLARAGKIREHDRPTGRTWSMS